MERTLLWTVIQISTELLFVIFHASVGICVFLRMLKRDKTFTTGFFALYLVQSAADLVIYVMVCQTFMQTLLRCFQCVLVVVLPSRGILIEALFGNLPRRICLFIIGYARLQQFTTHMGVAWNRYSIIASKNETVR